MQSTMSQSQSQSQSLGQIEELMGATRNVNENKLKRGNSLRDSIRSNFSEEDLQDGNTENTLRSLFSEASLKLDYMLERKKSQISVISDTNSEHSSFSSDTEDAKLYVELMAAEREESQTHKEIVMANLQKISMDLEDSRKSKVELETKLDHLRNQLAQRRALRNRFLEKAIAPDDVIGQTGTEPTKEEKTIVGNKTALVKKDKKATKEELMTKLDDLRYQLAQRRALRDRVCANVIDSNVVIVQPRTEPQKEESTVKGTKTNVVVDNATEDNPPPKPHLVQTSTERQSYWFSSLGAKRQKVEGEPSKRYAELPSANREADRLMTKMKRFVRRNNRQKEQNHRQVDLLGRINGRRSFFSRNRLIPV